MLLLSEVAASFAGSHEIDVVTKTFSSSFGPIAYLS
jgi:hypothetical protein